MSKNVRSGVPSAMVAGTLCVALAAIVPPPAAGQTAEASRQAASPAELVEAGKPTLETIGRRLNAAQLCKPLTFDIRSVSGLLGFPIPSFIPIDTNLRWDQDRQTVKRFASSPTQVAFDFELGCQPSSNGAVLDYLGLTPETLRLEDEVACTGTRMASGELASLVCKVDGRIGRFLAKHMLGLSDKVGRLLPMNLAVPVGGNGAASEATISKPSREIVASPEKPEVKTLAEPKPPQAPAKGALPDENKAGPVTVPPTGAAEPTTPVQGPPPTSADPKLSE